MSPIKIGLLVGGDDALDTDKDIDELLYWLPEEKADSFLTDGEYVSKDIAIAGKMKELYPNIQLDLFKFKDINTVEKGKKRLAKNDVNLVLGMDLVEAFWEKDIDYHVARKVFSAKSSRMFPMMGEVDWILDKGIYLKDLAKAGIPVAPTFVVYAKDKTRGGKFILNKAKRMGFKDLISKPILGASGKGFKKWSTKGLDKKGLAERLDKYMDNKSTKKFPGILFQPLIKGFQENWEIRTYWLNGVFKYAIGTIHDFDINDDYIAESDELPEDVIKHCKELGRRALKIIPKNIVNGTVVKPALIRVDCGCCLDNGAKNMKDRYFVNEVEYQNTTLWSDFTDYDVITNYADVLVKKAKEIHKLGWSASKKSNKSNKISKRSKSKRRSAKRITKRRKRS